MNITVTKKILLLSAYDAHSHRRWRESMVAQFPECQWTSLALPARHFSWRIRGNSLTWALNQKEVLDRGFDLIVATSMVDLSSLIGMAPSLAGVPSILYFHENQFAYPASCNQRDSVEPQMVSLYAAISATKLIFNSEYNRLTFVQGVADLARRLPDHVPAALDRLLLSKSQILPVPIEDECFAVNHDDGEGDPIFRKFKSSMSDTSVHIVWNHRWEYDKGPDRLLALIRALPVDLNVLFHIVGQGFRQTSPVFATIRAELESRHMLGHWGYLESIDDYRGLLSASDIVLSTAIHEFQGLSVLEAVAHGCLPLVPDRLSYPELFPEVTRYYSRNHDLSHETNRSVANQSIDQSLSPEQTSKETNNATSKETKDAVKILVAMVEALNRKDKKLSVYQMDVQAFSWSALAPLYRAILT